MECNYQVVESENLSKSDKVGWKLFWREIHIISGVWTMFYMSGLFSGAPTVIIPQIRQDDKDAIDDELASWLYSISNITAIPWVLILPTVTRYTGRKPLYTLTCLSTLAVYIIMYFSTTPYQILTAGVIQGYSNASNVIIMTMILTEYSSVKYRAVFMNLTSTSFLWGLWTANAIGVYFHWKYIAVLGLICSAYTFTTVFSPESPIWLVTKGKYHKAEESFKWLHGNNKQSRKELQDAIKSHISCQDIKNKKLDSSLFETVKKREFYKPVLLCILIYAQYIFSGKYVCSAYAIDVINKMTGSDDVARLVMLILDGVTIVGIYSGIFLLKLLKRKILYYSSAFFGVLFLFLISLYLYLVRISILSENDVVTIFLLVAYSLSISCGSMIMGYGMCNEIILLKYQSVVFTINSLFLFGTTAALLKLAPMAFEYMGVDGMFFFNCVTCGICTVILYIHLPDTEGKTILEIEELFIDNKK